MTPQVAAGAFAFANVSAAAVPAGVVLGFAGYALAALALVGRGDRGLFAAALRACSRPALACCAIVAAVPLARAGFHRVAGSAANELAVEVGAAVIAYAAAAWLLAREHVRALVDALRGKADATEGGAAAVLE